MMLPKSEMSYSQRVIADGATERPSYFMCGKNSVSRLKHKAREEADKILNEFRQFFIGEFSIEIKEIEWPLCYSIGATLKVNGEACREYDTADLLFIDLNELMLKRILETKEVPTR